MFPLGVAVAVLGQLLGNVELYQGVSFQCMRVCSLNCLLLTGILLSVSNCNHPGEGNGTPLQYSCLENPMDGGA